MEESALKQLGLLERQTRRAKCKQNKKRKAEEKIEIGGIRG